MADDNTGVDPNSPFGFRWISSWDYPTKISNDIAVAIATDIRNGASFTAACMKQGVTRRKGRTWMQWGEEAYNDDANPDDYRAQYLNFFLMVMQAVGIAAVGAQQAALMDDPAWWLLHHPEARGEWVTAANVQPANQLEQPDDASVTATQIEVPAFDATTLRTALRTLIEAGVAIPAETPAPSSTVDSTNDEQRRTG